MLGSSLRNWKQRASSLQRESYSLYLACREPRTPWVAKALAWCVIAYAVSPIDLIPDPIPILGQLDDLLLIPLGVILVRRLIPPSVMEDCRRRSEERWEAPAAGWIAAGVVLTIWLLCGVWIARFI
jgi:uncharacterized membrane protein YkvA (DUF1232 family)